MGVEINQQQVAGWVKTGLAAGGPVYDIAIKKLHLTDADYQMYATLAAYILPPIIVGVWSWIANRRSAQIAKVASFTPAQQAEALAKTPDTAKVLVAEAVPGVATVVLKNGVGNGLGKLAASEAHPNIVTEQDNAADVAAGTRAATK
jgi:hypothetical protein